MLVLRRADLAAILGHARAVAPQESCGLLGGRDEGAVRRVEAALPCRNVAGAPEWEYVAHAQDQLAAMLRIEDDLGLDVVGVYHSHPRGPPGPSAVDAARANLPGASYLIAWLAPAPGWGSWRWRPGQPFAPEPVEVRDGI